MFGGFNMSKKIMINVKGQPFEIEEGRKYRIEITDENFLFIGNIIENMEFNWDGRVCFYILNDADDEDYQVCDNEIVKIEPIEGVKI